VPGARPSPIGGAASGSGAFGNGGTGGVGQSGGVPRAGGGAVGSQECASADLSTALRTPDILFVIDGSGSMCAEFGGSTRWQSLRAALLDPMNGVIFRAEKTVHFGLMIYDGTIDPILAITAVGGSPSPGCAGMYFEAKAAGMCPGLVQVPVALNNAMAIDMAFPATELGGSTPTDRAMNVAVDQLIAMRPTDPDVKAHPQYIILATDGQPNDICMGGVGGDGAAQKAGVIAAVDRAAMMGISTFVISLAGGDQGLQSHLDEVAKHGQPMNPMAVTFAPDSPAALVDTLSAIVGGAVGCEIALKGKVLVGSECRGSVAVNGTKLPCCRADAAGAMQCNGVPANPADGWVLKDESTIELVGPACNAFLMNPQALLTAGFPCDVIVM
jgi:hypothetical protein